MARIRRDDDYDDFDDDPRPRRRRPQDDSTGMTAVKIVAIIGGVVVTVVLTCGGLAYYAISSVFQTADKLQAKVGEQFEKMRKEQEKQQQELANSDKEKSKEFANNFVQEVRGQRGDAAYAMTTPAYQGRVSLEQFKELIAKQAKVLERFGGFFTDIHAPDKGTTYTFKESIPDFGKLKKLLVTAVKQGNGWKVDQFSIEVEDPVAKEP